MEKGYRPREIKEMSITTARTMLKGWKEVRPDMYEEITQMEGCRDDTLFEYAKRKGLIDG